MILQVWGTGLFFSCLLSLLGPFFFLERRFNGSQVLQWLQPPRPQVDGATEGLGSLAPKVERLGATMGTGKPGKNPEN